MEDERRERAIKYMFLLYGQENNTDRIKAYSYKLQDVPLEVLKVVLNKLVLTSKRLPTIADITEAGQNLIREANGTVVKSWSEAQAEIERGLRMTWFHGCLGEISPDHPDYGKSCEPMWSTPEIKAAVDSYGLDNIGKSLVTDMPIVWSQVRKAYESACERRAEREINAYVLGNAPLLENKLSNLLTGSDEQ